VPWRLFNSQDQEYEGFEKIKTQIAAREGEKGSLRQQFTSGEFQLRGQGITGSVRMAREAVKRGERGELSQGGPTAYISMGTSALESQVNDFHAVLER